MCPRPLGTAAVVVALFVMGLMAGPAGAHDPVGASCDAKTDAVLRDATDWAGFELAGWMIGTKCLLDSGDRKRSMPPAAARAAYGGQRVAVIGSAAAVPTSKLSGLSVVERLVGWADGSLAEPRQEGPKWLRTKPSPT